MLTSSDRNCQHVVAKGPDEVEHHAAVSPAETQRRIGYLPLNSTPGTNKIVMRTKEPLAGSKAAVQCCSAGRACRCTAESVQSSH